MTSTLNVAHIGEEHTSAVGAAYHNPNQLWQVAEQVLNIRNDYALKVRHYTETVYETVLFFLPA
jgi:hypothetical protein